MSDLTDISFILPPNEYGCVYTWTTLGSGPATDLQKMPVLAKKIIFSDEAHFDLGGYVKKQKSRIWGTEKPHAYIEKPTHPKRVTVWCGFWSEAQLGHFSSKMSKERWLQSMAIVIGGCCSQKLKRRILATFGFNRTALRATQPKLHSMFCPMFLKIALSAAELMSFGHFGAAIWHRITIICRVPSKINITLTIQRQFTLLRIIFVKLLVKYSYTQSIMCLKIGPIV